MFQAAGQQARAQHQQQVADDRAGDRRLDQIEQSGADGEDRDDQLGGVAEGSVEQAAQARAGVMRQLLGPLADEAGERDEADSGEDKDDRRAGSLRHVEHERDRAGDEHDEQNTIHGEIQVWVKAALSMNLQYVKYNKVNFGLDE